VFTQLSPDPATWARQLVAVAVLRGWRLQLCPTVPVGKSFLARFHSCFVYSGHEFSPEPGAAPALGGVSQYCHAKAVAITVPHHHHQQLHLQVSHSSQKAKEAGFVPSSLPAHLRLLIMFDSRLTSSKAGKSFLPNSWRQTWDGQGVPDDANTLFYLAYVFLLLAISCLLCLLPISLRFLPAALPQKHFDGAATSPCPLALPTARFGCGCWPCTHTHRRHQRGSAAQGPVPQLTAA